VLLMLAAIDGTFSSLLTCHPKSANVGGGAATMEECTALKGPILISLTWLLEGLHKYEGVVTGVFTILLAAFTGRLWFSTEKLWSVTLRSAKTAERALTELEAPFISVKIIETGIARGPDDGHNFHTLSVVIVNYGRTPARIIEVADKPALVEHNEGLPPEVNPAFASRNSIPYGVIAPQQGESQGWTQNLFAFTLKYSVEGTNPLKNNKMFFYGFIRYATIFDEVFRVGFCFMYDVVSEKWVLTGGDRHNYFRKETEPYPPPLY
jgi:hypothetical protein